MKDNDLRNGYNNSNPLAALRLMDQSVYLFFGVFQALK